MIRSTTSNPRGHSPLVPVIRWEPRDPIWVEQWSHAQTKLEALHSLVQEQLQLGHIRLSWSPWNTVVFVIKKANGTSHMLKDLRKINDRMEIVRTPLGSIPWVSVIPANFTLTILDIKDCFFSIPLHPDDCARFAFSVPSFNYSSLHSC